MEIYWNADIILFFIFFTATHRIFWHGYLSRFLRRGVAGLSHPPHQDQTKAEEKSGQWVTQQQTLEHQSIHGFFVSTFFLPPVCKVFTVGIESDDSSSAADWFLLCVDKKLSVEAYVEMHELELAFNYCWWKANWRRQTHRDVMTGQKTTVAFVIPLHFLNSDLLTL